MIAVIDYDGGNTKSILNVLNRCQIDYCVTNEENKIMDSSKIILPGVSNFSFCMNSLKKKNLELTEEELLFLLWLGQKKLAEIKQLKYFRYHQY